MFTITAKSMLTAQAVKLSKGQAAALKARADRRRAKFGDFGVETINVPVHDATGALLGHIGFQF